MDPGLSNKNNTFAYYYFDIETVPLQQYICDREASFEPSKSKIITIQYQRLDMKTGAPLSELVMLKEWEQNSSEKHLIEKFKQIYLDNGYWAFIPVGNNLLFENRFMKYKLRQFCNLDGLYLWHRPMVDLKHILIIMNDGKFRGSAGLIGKNGKSRNMAQWYNSKDFYSIEQYVTEEASNFISAYYILKKEIPRLRYQIAYDIASNPNLPL